MPSGHYGGLATAREGGTHPAGETHGNQSNAQNGHSHRSEHKANTRNDTQDQ